MKLPIVTFSTQDDLSQSLVKNLEKSIRLAGIENPFIVKTCELPGDSGFDTEGYWNVIKGKADNVYRVMEEFEQALIIDNDIVFLKNDMGYLESLLNRYDFIAGSDFPSQHCFIGGFYVMTKKLRHIFDPEIMNSIEFNGDNFGDQGVLNEYLKRGATNVFMLSPTEYCNGWMWFNFQKSLNPVCVHYNWISSLREKITRMKSCHHWFLS